MQLKQEHNIPVLCNSLKYALEELNKKERIEKCRNNFKLFLLTYLPHYFPLQFCDFHNDLIKVIEKLKSSEKHLLIAPRGYAKSTIAVTGQILWDICYKREEFIVIIGSTTKNAQIEFGNIIDEIETNDLMIRDFGLKPKIDKRGNVKKWTDGDIVLHNNVRVICKGSNEAIRGIRRGEKRPGKIILDDIERDKEIESDVYRKKLKKWFGGAIRNLGDENTKIIMVGTVLHWDSLIYGMYRNKDKRFIIHYYQAITPDGKALWKEKQSLERLREIESEDVSAFQSEYMNCPVSEGERTFNSERFKTFDYLESENAIQYNEKGEVRKVPINHLFIWSYLDPALTEKKTSDYSCLITLGRDNRNFFFILECSTVKLNPDRLTELVAMRRKERFVWQELGVESNGFQRLLIDELERKFYKHNITVPIKKIINTKNKIGRIKTLNPLIERGVIRFRSDMKYCYPLLIEQMDYFPQAKLDSPDALHGAYYMQVNKGVMINDVG